MNNKDRMTENDPGVPLPVEPLALFEILVRENADSLTAFLRAAAGDPAAADDLFQDTMLIAWRKIGEYDRTRPFGAWLRGIARRLVLAHHRATTRAGVPLDDHALDYLDRRMTQIDRQPGDTLNEKVAALTDCLGRLEEAYRQPVELYYRQHKTTDWIAGRLSLTRDAVQKRLQRARELLVHCLERKAVFAPLE